MTGVPIVVNEMFTESHTKHTHTVKSRAYDNDQSKLEHFLANFSI